MSALTPTDRRRLVSILGLLGSDHGGERASAGLLASRLLRDRGLQWQDVVIDTDAPLPQPARGRSWSADLELAQRHISFCRAWEQDFVRSVAGRIRLSSKQRLVLSEVADALRRRGFA